MKKKVYTLKHEYIYNPAHTGAPYSINDGESFMNSGDFAEVMLKDCLNLPTTKDACGRYDMTDDIPTLKASVKSSRATLVNKILGNDFESVKNTYFANVHSKKWIWVSIKNEKLTAYYMNAKEFESFLDTWARFDENRKVIRFKAESLKMLNWLEERI